MADHEDHSQLFKEIGGFIQRRPKKVETKVVTGLVDNVTEKRGATGLQRTIEEYAITHILNDEVENLVEISSPSPRPSFPRSPCPPTAGHVSLTAPPFPAP